MLKELLDEAQLELLELFARACATTPIAKATFIEPTEEFFPDEYQPTLVGAGKLLHRLLVFAGWGDRELQIEDERVPGDEKRAEQLAVTQPVVDFIAVEGKRVVFQVEQLGPGDVTAAALCHQVARAVVAPAGEELALAAATTVALGFGLLTLPTALSYRRSSVFTGHHTITRGALVMTGAMSPGDLAFLLAVWLVLRGSGEAELLKKHLVAEQAENVEKWVEALRPARLELFERLKLPYSDEKIVRRVPLVAPFDVRALQQADEAHRQPHQGSTAKRIWERKTIEYTMMGGFLGFFAAIPVAIKFMPLVWLPMVVGTIGGVMLGRRGRRYHCGACSMVLHAHENLCPKCGARIEGESELVTSIAQMADDEEDDELTRAALAAAPVDEED